MNYTPCSVSLHNLPTYSWMRKLRSARLFYNITAFEVGFCAYYIERVQWKNRCVLCPCHFSVTVKGKIALVGCSVGLSVILYTKILQAGSPVRTYTQAWGLIPSRGAQERQPIDVSLSYQCFSLCLSFPLTPSLPLSLKSINLSWGEERNKGGSEGGRMGDE